VISKLTNALINFQSKTPRKHLPRGAGRRKRSLSLPLPNKPNFDHLKQMEGSTDIYDRFNLYIFPERFILEPRDRDGGLASDSYLEIDRDSDRLSLLRASDNPISLSYGEVKTIHGIVGIIKLVSGIVFDIAGYALITIKQAILMGTLNGHEVWLIKETEILPYKRTTLHLTEKQKWYNRNFTDMVNLVLSTGGFYFSRSFDLSHSVQWLVDNTTPMFKQLPMMGRADERFVWNRYLSAPISAIPDLYRYALPIIHGFFSSNRCVIGENVFQLFLISRRSVHRAGTRFYMRGVSSEGHSANFVETEQIVQFDRNGDPRNRYLTAFVQTRGSIPLFWSQRPNLRWQPEPTLKPADDQLSAYVRHMSTQRAIYGGKHVIVNLVNQRGREKRLGSELERVALQASLPFVRHNPFDFHRECHAMNWARLSILRDQLRDEITQFGFFASSVAHPERTRQQLGFFRTNCMDSLDRTNVVQAMIAKESLKDQLTFLGILHGALTVDDFPDLSSLFKNVWADNGDECSRQYAGTGALKADYTRLGKRTYGGAWNDGVNAVTRYFRNNFADGYRQDAIDLFLGNFRVDPDNLPPTFETTVLSFDYHGGAIIGAIFAAAMTILCVLVAENMTATIFWLVIFMALMLFIFMNGEEFVNQPKLKME
uniref:Phosphatidylinositol-3-phosphatase SAC1 n=2 Tax=Ascaris TaxID=6251 RepID=A0A9J2Q5E8_ASCLU